MGSLCKSGPTVTNTSSSTTPAGLSQINDIWSKVSSAASTPYQPYGGKLVADLNPTQTAGISNVSNAAGSASPYFDLAAQYGKTGAASINPNDIAKYESPYTQQVIDATQANFNEGNQQQQQQVRGNAAKVGALGGDRVGVAQAELARQQKLAQDPTIAGLRQQGYTQALGAAQQDRAAQAQGAYTFGSLAPAVQNTAIQGGTAQIGAGTVAQQNQQQNLSADYQQYLNKMAYPYQQASFLAQYGLPTATSMGTNSTGTSTAYPSQPSMLQNIMGGAGLGLAAYDAFGGGGGGSYTGDSGMYAPSNPNANLPGWDSSGNSINRAAGGRVGMSRGGRAMRRSQRPRFADGGFIGQVHAIRQALRGGGPVMDMSRGPSGAYSMHGYAGGGQVDEDYVDGSLPWANIFSSIPLSAPHVTPMQAPQAPSSAPAAPSSRSGDGGGGMGDMAKMAMKFLPMLMASRGGRIGFADGGDVEMPFDRFPMAGEISAGGDGVANPRSVADALRAFGAQSTMAPQPAPIANVPMPPPRPPIGAVADASPYSLPSMITNPGGGGGEPQMMPSKVLAYDGATPPAGGLRAPPDATSAPMLPPMGRDSPRGALGLSPEARMGLLSASLGILGSKASSAMGALGEGGQQGVKTYTEAKNSVQRNEIEARKLIQQAEQFAQTLGVHKDQLEETKRAHRGIEGYRDESLARGKFQYLGPSADGTKSIFLDQKTGETVERELQIGAKPGKATATKPLPASIQKDLGEKAQAFSQLDSLSTGFKPEYAGSVLPAAGDVKNWFARQTGLGNTDAAEWWQEYARYRNVVRNKLFGSALTMNESREWEKADVNPGMDPKVLENNLKMQRRIADAAMRRRAESLVKQGYSQEGIEAEMGIPMAGGATPTPTPRATGDAPARPATVPAGSAYSPSRKQWRAPDGAVFDDTGVAVR